jgi:hypothetical protein
MHKILGGIDLDRYICRGAVLLLRLKRRKGKSSVVRVSSTEPTTEVAKTNLRGGSALRVVAQR